MPVATEIPGVKSTEVEFFKHTLEVHGFDFTQMERDAKLAEEKLPTIDQAMQSSLNFATKTQIPILPLRDTGSLHAAAKTELDDYVEVLIDVPIPTTQRVWNALEIATIPVEIRSSYLALKDVVVEMRLEGPATLLPLPIHPPTSASKRYFTRLEPGVTQRTAFLARASQINVAHPVDLKISVILSAEVVPYATRFPGTRVTQIWP